MTSKQHEYQVNNITVCQVCRDLYEKYKDEIVQINNCHTIQPIDNGTNNTQKNNKKIFYDATIRDFYRGANLREKPGYKGLSQLHAYEVVSDDEDNK